MPTAQAKVASKIDDLMAKASDALVAREYFACERLAADALRRAVLAGDFDRAARIALPLQESRRQIRDLAFDAGTVSIVAGALPTGSDIRPGLYLLCPPRVGVEGRLLREAAMERRTPVIVVVREPTTREGQWPLVAVGPVTVRVKFEPPAARKGRGRGAPMVSDPTREWFLSANERLGDAAIASVGKGIVASARAAALLDRLDAVPDHEKLHQRFEEAAREAARDAAATRRKIAARGVKVAVTAKAADPDLPD